MRRRKRLHSAAVLNQKAVTAHLSSTQLLPFGFAERSDSYLNLGGLLSSPRAGQDHSGGKWHQAPFKGRPSHAGPHQTRPTRVRAATGDPPVYYYLILFQPPRSRPLGRETFFPVLQDPDPVPGKAHLYRPSLRIPVDNGNLCETPSSNVRACLHNPASPPIGRPGVG